MDWLVTTDYDLAREILQRGVAAVFALAFVSSARQFPALAGSHGLLPAERFLAAVPFRRAPSLFHWRYSDRLLVASCTVGAVLAVATVAGLPQAGPPWVPLIVFLTMWALYLSVVDIGQTFYGFGWESLLCESGFVVAFLGSDRTGVPWPTLILLWWLVFRLEFGAGMIKMRGDRSWRDLTALYYHHETQPMPNPLSRWAHGLPMPWHRFEVLGNHFAQLIVPFVLFVPGPVGSAAAVVMILTQLWLVITGNFAWLNVLTMILACSAISDGVVDRVSGTTAWEGGAGSVSPAFAVVVLLASAWLVWLSRRPLANLFRSDQLMNASFDRLRLVNAYGAFGSVTKERFEVIIEGSSAPSGDDWREYGFRGKPGDPHRRSRQFAPYHLRLDWMLWFVPLGGGIPRWFAVFLTRLLEADPATLRLLRVDPFEGRAPLRIRVQLYRYRYASRAERRETGAWWIRTPVSMLVPPVGGPALRGPGTPR